MQSQVFSLHFLTFCEGLSFRSYPASQRAARATRAGLDENRLYGISDGADIYMRRWQQYARGLKRIG
jgi:hypothetical protein